MEYKSKYTASEIDARLSKVFDSTLQTKEVEVSEDTTIKADEGFLGLKEVNVKVSGGGGSASAWRYFDVSKAPDTQIVFNLAPFLVKYDATIAPPNKGTDYSIVTAFAVDDGAILMHDGVSSVWSDMLALEGITPDVLSQFGVVEITEEEFYAL